VNRFIIPTIGQCQEEKILWLKSWIPAGFEFHRLKVPWAKVRGTFNRVAIAGRSNVRVTDVANWRFEVIAAWLRGTGNRVTLLRRSTHPALRPCRQLFLGPQLP
jgi:hypothetical protein